MEFIDQDLLNADFPQDSMFASLKFDAQFDIQLPIYTDDRWAKFDPTFDTASALYSKDVLMRTLSLSDIAPDIHLSDFGTAMRDSPPPVTRAGSIEEDTFSSSSTDTDGHTPRQTTPEHLFSSSTGSRSSNTQRSRPSVASAPYRLEDRPDRTPISQQEEEEEEEEGEEEEVHESSSSTHNAVRPSRAVFLADSRNRIREEMEFLSELLKENKASTVPHHPGLTCPVFDCKKGGWNPLLHGFDPNRIREKGQFYTSNEVFRHVNTKHLSDNDLRCNYYGCDAQARLDVSGKRQFCRVDVLRKHLKANPLHKLSVSEDLRLKYKLF